MKDGLTGMDLDHHLLDPLVASVQLDEPLMTAGEDARLLRVPRSSVYDYARRQHGRLPSLVVGRHRRFHRSDVEAWLAHVRAT